MLSLKAHAGAPEKPVHQDWIALWAPNLEHGYLRNDMLRSGRFADRITADILLSAFDYQATDVEDFTVQKGYDEGCAQSMTLLFYQVGLMRFASALSTLIADKSLRQSLRLEDRRLIDGVIRYRSHAGASLQSKELEKEDFGLEGYRCWLSWLDLFPQPIRYRAQLQNPRMLNPKPVTDETRGAFFAEVSADPLFIVDQAHG